MGGKLGPETSTKELRDKSSRRGIHEHRDGSINRDRDVRVRFCAGPVECATKPLSTPAGGRRIAQSLDFAGTFSLETRRRLRSGLRPGNMAAAALRQFGHDERTLVAFTRQEPAERPVTLRPLRNEVTWPNCPMEAPPLARLARIVTIHETAKSLVCTESQWRVRVGAFWSGGAADRAVRSPLQPCNEARRIPAPKSGTTDRCLIVLLLLGISDCSAYSRAFAARGIHDRPAAHLRRAQS